ncbi:hypothetical protein [Nodularia sphaerocarpa]|uniref:hypothetical protein n=1 Tax=Nodularia sphaerocarpa TaxID=137816 RepID=UPI001EFB9EB9|nr:hypothetical protein [Nodularia sphaerocarpa]MDB9373784.1 hypothetical protein [Nodularia sphaerocarpa CS-585]MDB9377462.1 hypothetical protein [Nodularia sphaerocarpa CS-585A2]ULP72908.1 hypothetical protein BDGGKGIB_02560 [Nodularia sphaerocarpa UHCC 0038]
MKAKIILCGVLGLLGLSSLIFHATTQPQNSIKAEVATTPKNLPQNLETAVREKMAQQLEINSELLKLTKSEIATWEDCLPHKSGVIPTQPCPAKSHSGWRVTMSGQGENWVYYVTNNGFITLDTTASLNQTILSALSTKLSLETNNISIIAAQLSKGLPDCPINTTCKVQSILGWRILVKGREKPFFLGLDGQDLNYGNLSLFLPQETAEMPRNIGEKVLEDVVSRHDNLNSNLRVESIKAITWNWCQGAETGPTKPEMGNCQDIEQAGWQMIVIMDANRYVYYIHKRAISDPNFSPIPDGMQSLPSSLVSVIKKDAAKRAKVSENIIGLHSTTPKFFDSCLNIDNQKLSCRQSIQAGWEVNVLGGNVPSGNPSWASAARSYNVNLAGNDLRFVHFGVWVPVP